MSDVSPKSTEKDTSRLLSKSTSGASFLMLVQFLTKLLTFSLNQVLIRYISPKSFGLSTYLEFLVSTVLFFSREGERLSIQRTENTEVEEVDQKKDHGTFFKDTKRGVLQSIVNFGFLPLIIGVPLSVGLFTWQYQTNLFQSTLLALPHHKWSLALIWLSIVLELVVEPIYAINQFELNFKRRSQFEGVAVFNKCITTFVSILLFKKYFSSQIFEGLAILAFAMGQFTYSFTLFWRYSLSFIQDNKLKFANQQLRYSIQKIYSRDEFFYFNTKIFVIWKSLFVQMIFKQFLTEGDKILINYLCSVDEQGVYSVVTNYGSIVARLILQPIEESVRLLFTRMLSSREDKRSVLESYNVVRNLSVFYLNLSILIILGGVTNASFLLKVLLGSKTSVWSQTNVFDIFPQYVMYIPFLVFNGIFEALFSSIATEKDIKRFSYFMTFSSVVVLISSYAFIEKYQMGLSGLILSNSINMSLRIIYCCFAIKKFYKNFNFNISALGVLNYVKYPVAVGLTLESIQYKFILKGRSPFTDSFAQLASSVTICFICLLSLCYIERDIVLGSVKKIIKRGPKID